MPSSTSSHELTVREAAHRVARTEETVRRWIWSGRLAAHKHGNVLYIQEEALEQLSPGGASQASTRGTRKSLSEWVSRLDEWRDELADTTRPSAGDLVREQRDEHADY